MPPKFVIDKKYRKEYVNFGPACWPERRVEKNLLAPCKKKSNDLAKFHLSRCIYLLVEQPASVSVDPPERWGSRMDRQPVGKMPDAGSERGRKFQGQKKGFGR
jgi:hypothetical protein